MSETTRTQAAPATRPTPRWWGPMVSLLLLVATLWFFAYAVLDIPWQQELGAWNYLIGWVIVLAMVFSMRAWRGDPNDGWEPGPTYTQQIKDNVRDFRVFLGKVFSRY